MTAKRLLDLAVAVPLLLLLLPVAAVIWIAIIVVMGRPVLFLQQRPGYRGLTMTVAKFRTMRNGSGPDAARLTRLGRLLRASSLDELPQLWNVVRGDLSLVGPRPLLMEYLPLYTPRQSRRQEVLPGITGWAQVCGRNALSWEEKFELDVWYVDHQSLLLDLKILALTVLQVLRRDGISASGQATMPRFTGSPRGKHHE